MYAHVHAVATDMDHIRKHRGMHAERPPLR